MIAPRIGGCRTDKKRWRTRLGSCVVGDHLLIGSQVQVGRQSIKPILWPVNLVQRLQSLAAMGQIVLVIIGILAESESPLPQIVQAVGGTGFRLCPAQRGQKKARENGYDRDDDHKFDKRKCLVRRCGHSIYLRKYNAHARIAMKLTICRKALFLLIALSFPRGALAQVTNVMVPSADTFVRLQAPAANYGGAGAISVSGSAAVNGVGQTNGLFDSLLRFPASNLVASVDASLGTHDWLVTRATLRFFEVGAPGNSLFNRGVGAFEIRWAGSDGWVEGTGTPGAPTTDGVTYNDLPALLVSGGSVSLGYFTNNGFDGSIACNLGLTQPLVDDLRSGGLVSFYLTAASSTVGFTADSRSFATASARPSLEITAVPRPAPPLLSILRLDNNQVSVGFDTVSNWNYVLQRSGNVSAGGPVIWANLMAIPSQPSNSHVQFVDGITNQPSFYRLSLTP